MPDDFRRHGRQPRNYFSPREQRRLLMLVLALGLVLFLMNEARKPKYWRWLFAIGQTEQNDEAQPSEETSLPKDAVPWKEWSAQHKPKDESVEQPKTDTTAPSTDETTSGSYFPGVRPELLKTIQDKTRFRPEEQDAWFNLLSVLKKADPAALHRASIGRIARIQLAEQSEAYRGEVVTTRGTIRRAHWLDAPKNDAHITGYYQLWITPDDSPKEPIVVYCLDLPKDFPTGMDLSRRAMITGFYYKRWLHTSGEGLQLSPVILAQGLDKEPTRSFFSDIPIPGGWEWLAIIGGAALVAVLVVSYVFRRTRRAPRRPLPERISPEDFPTTEQSEK